MEQNVKNDDSDTPNLNETVLDIVEKPGKNIRDTHSIIKHSVQSVENDSLENTSSNEDKRIFDCLRKLLKCTVCFETQFDSNQCKNGHLICRGCTSRLESNANSAVQAKCPTCRVYLQPGMSRCLLAQQLAYELPAPCSYCGLYFRQLEMNQHESSICNWRPVKCRYALFGCPWTGRFIDAKKHQDVCFLPKKKVSEIEPIILEYIAQKTKPVLELEQAWKEFIELLSDKQRGIEISIKDISLRGKARDIGSTEFILNGLCFTGTTNSLFQYGSQMTLVDVCVDLDNNKFYYRIKFTGNITPSVKFRMLSFSVDDLKFDILDHVHAPMFTPNTESQRYSCNLKSKTKQSMISCRSLIEKSILEANMSSIKLSIMIFHDLNRCSLRVTPVDIHEWTPNRSTIESMRTLAHAHDEASIGTSNVRGHTERLHNNIQLTTTPISERNMNRSTRHSRNWECSTDRSNITANESLLLDLSNQAYDDAGNYFSEQLRGLDPDFEANQQTFYNQEMYSMMNNNSCDFDDTLFLANMVATKSTQRNRMESMGDVILRGKCPLNSISRKIRHRKIINGCTYQSESTQTMSNKMSKRSLIPFNQNILSVDTNMSSSSPVNSIIKSDMPKQIFGTLNNLAPYFSRMHLSNNLQVICRKPVCKQVRRDKTTRIIYRKPKKNLKLQCTPSKKNQSVKRIHFIKKSMKFLRARLNFSGIWSLTAYARLLLIDIMKKGLSSFRIESSLQQENSDYNQLIKTEDTNLNSNISTGYMIDFGKILTIAGANALKRPASVYQGSFRLDPLSEIYRFY